jgi:predicted PurR-regulated permease PerM
MTLKRTSLLSLAGLVTLIFAWILWPYFGALFWAMVLAIVFDPLFTRLERSFGGRPTAAALATVGLVILSVILPLVVVAMALTREAASLFDRLKSGELSIGRLLQPMLDNLPAWATNGLARLGLADVASVRDRMTGALTEGTQSIATQAIAIGQGTLGFVVSLGVMLYLTFFFLRDGRRLVARFVAVMPMDAGERDKLLDTFTVAVRATVKGDLLVAVMQGASGGLIFAILGIHGAVLWAVTMAIASLLPAIGAALVWLPVALYLIATGATWSGVILIGYGVLVIGLVDNIVRPFLVGKDTRMPDYVVLISTLGGIESFGLHGFIIGPVVAALFLSVWSTLSAQASATAAPRT